MNDNKCTISHFPQGFNRVSENGKRSLSFQILLDVWKCRITKLQNIQSVVLSMPWNITSAASKLCHFEGCDIWSSLIKLVFEFKCLWIANSFHPAIAAWLVWFQRPSLNSESKCILGKCPTSDPSKQKSVLLKKASPANLAYCCVQTPLKLIT